MRKKVLILMMSALLLLVPFNSSGKTCASEQSENEANLFVLIPTEKGITREDFSLSVKDANVLREKLRERYLKTRPHLGRLTKKPLGCSRNTV